MKVYAYSIKQFEQRLIESANDMFHELTFDPVSLNLGTANKAAGNDAVIVFTNDDLSAPVINTLCDMGVRYIVTRSVGTDHIDVEQAKKLSMKVMNIPAYSPQAVAEHAVALAMALSRKLVPTFESCRDFDFRIEDHMGFNFYQKTVGIIGLGRIGQACASIFAGMGCRVLGYDLEEKMISSIDRVDLSQIWERSDIISLHVPLTAQTHYLVNAETLMKMKTGVMLINTSRGGVIDTKALLQALENKKVGYAGLDVYENERGWFFKDQRLCRDKDPLLQQLMALENVLITPHQAFLTIEAVSEIAGSVINILNNLEASEKAKSHETEIQLR